MLHIALVGYIIHQHRHESRFGLIRRDSEISAPFGGIHFKGDAFSRNTDVEVEFDQLLAERRCHRRNRTEQEFFIREANGVLVRLVRPDNLQIAHLASLVMDQLHIDERLIHRIEESLDIFQILFRSLGDCDLFTDIIVGTDDEQGLAVA